MIPRIAEFEKVSLDQFMTDMKKTFGANFSDELIKEIYEEIKIPTRATSGSAGYDFYTPIGFLLPPEHTIKIPTGIRVNIDEGWVFEISPKSGLGTEYRMQLDNTIGKIDNDYYYSKKNEGHISVQVTNDSKNEKVLILEAGDKFVQGTFYIYGITRSDNVTNVRDGGFGSTGK